MFTPMSFGILAFSSLLVLCRGQVFPDGCTLQDQCYESAAAEALELVEKHDQLVPLCEALKNDTGFQNCAVAYGNDSCDTNPWTGPANAFVESLCSEDNLRIFSAAQSPHGQCFHLNFAVECAAKSLVQYESIGKFLRSEHNESVCSTVSTELRRCAAGVYEGCIQKESIRTALNGVMGALLHSVGCQDSKDAEGPHSGDQPPTPQAPSSSGSSNCETRMTHVTACLREILSPNTVANELLEKVRTQPMDYDETFCRTYENVIECKKNILNSDCYTKAARSALERNIKAFDTARSWLCEDGQAKLREFAGGFHGDGCNPNDDAISECSNTFVHNVSQSGSALSPGAANKLFQNQLDCIRDEFQSCKADGASLTVVDGYLRAARTAFVTVAVSGATRAAATGSCLLPFVLFFAQAMVKRVMSGCS